MNRSNFLAPTDLRDYLLAQGWNLNQAGLADRLYVLANERCERRQLVFPMDITAPDYEESVGKVIDKLSEIQRQPPQTLIAEVQAIKDDVVRFRVASQTSPDFILSLDFASTLVRATEQVFRAAACTAVKPRTHHPRLSLSEAGQFVEKAHFGHTEPGSFIFKISCPIHALDLQENLALQHSDVPFVRKATLSLKRGLVQLVDAIEAGTLDRLVDALKRSQMPLVSSNLCEALQSMHDEQIENSIDISVQWSSLLQVADEDSHRSVIRIQSDYFSRIEEVRRELRPVESHREDTFVGTVETLGGDMGIDGQRSGEVILALLLPEGESIRARINLPAEDYAIADQAHMTDGAYVQITGHLHPGRQPQQLTSISRFHLLQLSEARIEK